MSEPNEDRDPIDRLADSFVGRLRAGERPSVSDYVARYPELAADVKELLPALVALEQDVSFDAVCGAGSAAASAPPTQLGEYTILREIGRGGMGVVYEAVQESLGRHVALKVFQAGGLYGSHVERFHREAKAAARLHHANIVPVHGVGEHGGVHYYAMQFIQGQSLNLVIDELKRLRRNASGEPSAIARVHTGQSISERLLSGRFLETGDQVDPPETVAGPTNGPAAPPDIRPASAEGANASDACSYDVVAVGEFSAPPSSGEFYRSVARVGLQVAEALAYAHAQGVLHRDIKPSNLLLDGRGTVWVTDFGLAKTEGTDDLSHTGDIVGTLQYMAPERLDGWSDPRSDVYGLGATLYELVALRPLFKSEVRSNLIEQILREVPPPLRKCDPRVPRDLETIVEKALAKEPRDRYATAQQLADDLRLFLADRTIRARRSTTAERFWRSCRRNPVLAGLATALLLVFALGLAGVTWKWRDAERARQVANERAEDIRRGDERLQEASSLVDVGTHFVAVTGWDDAEAAYSQAIELRPDLALPWEKRGDLYFQLGLFDLAAADFERGFRLQEPTFHWQWFRLALLRLYVGDTAGYRSVCNRMNVSFRGTVHSRSAIDLVRACVLNSEPVGDVTQSVTVAKRVVGWEPLECFLYVLGIAHYRAGQYDLAVERCKASMGGWTAREVNYPILAMAYHRLGRAGEARQAFAAAMQARERWIEKLYTSATGNWAVNQGATGNWPIDQLDWLEFELHYREASTLLGLQLPADDARLRVSRGRAFAGLRHPEKADDEYRIALLLRPDDLRIQLETHRNRAYQFVSLQQYERAAAEFALARQIEPGDSKLWVFTAVAYLAAGDTAAYRETCAAMVRQFASQAGRGVSFSIATACVLRPDSLADMSELRSAAQRGSQWGIDGARVLVAAHYRLGEYDLGLSALHRLSRVARLQPTSRFFAAMSHHRLGHADAARRELAEAIATMDIPPQTSLRTTQPFGLDPRYWADMVIERLLRKEAEALILGRPAAESGSVAVRPPQ